MKKPFKPSFRSDILSILAALLIISVAIIGGCKKDQTGQAGNGSPSASQIEKNVIVVRGNTLKPSLVEVDSDRLVFTAGGAGLQNVQPEMILVGDTSALAPYGFLRRITSVVTANGQTVCMTSYAKLTDVLNTGTISFTRTYSNADIFKSDTTSTNALHKKTLDAVTNTQNFTFTHDFGNGVTVKGALQVTATVDFQLDLNPGQPKSLSASIDLVKVESLEADISGGLNGSLAEYTIGDYELGKVTVYVFDTIPVTFDVHLVLSTGIDGQLSSTISTSASNTDETKGSITYENGSWSATGSQTNSFTYQPFVFTASGSVEPYLQLQLKFIPYGIPNSANYDSDIYLFAKLFADATASPTQGSGINMNLDWGVDIGAHASMTLYGDNILGYDNTFYSKTFSIWQGSIGIPVLTTAQVTNVTAGTASCGGNITADAGSTITARGVCWGTSSSPTISGNHTSDGTGTGTFSSALTGLSPSTTYYARAYATNAIGTSYGASQSFTTTASVAVPGNLAVAGSTSFGNVTVNTTAYIVFQLTNSGSTTINVSAITVNTPFTVNPATVTIAPGATSNITIYFTPNTTGDVSSTIVIASNAANSSITLQTNGTGVSAGNSGSGGSGSGGSQATAVPAIGTYGSCLAVVPNAGCPAFTDGVVQATVVSVNEATNQITFEVRNCNGSAFSLPSTLYVYSGGLCTGTNMGSVNFPATVYNHQATITEPDMTGTKTYYVFVQQMVNGQYIEYDAQAISITF